MERAKSTVLARLAGHQSTPLVNLDSQYRQIDDLLSATVSRGEGNSILLLGPRGVGKTSLVEGSIAHLKVQHENDFHVVRLNGFIQTDDKMALGEIWRQLGREMAVAEEETAQVNSYADTMASLLHLLSHPEEWEDDPDALGTGKTAKSVVLVLDEFDLFATHPRQTLLYNLLDLAQSRKAPVAVVGCSARIDAGEHLEKRVKSRFSHRWVYLSQANSLAALEEILRSALLLREADETAEIPHDFVSEWNRFIETKFLPAEHVRRLLKQTFYTTKSVPDLFSSVYVDVASMPSLDAVSASLQPTLSVQPPDSVLTMLPYLPSLQLSLLIAAARLDAVYKATVFTFGLVYSHYRELVSRARLQASAAGSIAQASKLWEEDVAAEAWEELAEWDLIVSAPGKGGESLQSKMWQCEVVLEEIVDAVGGTGGQMTDTMVRWCKEV